MVDKRKRKKSKRRTRKTLSPEIFKIVINNYLNDRSLRRQKRKQAQQKRNPLQRLGSKYPIQNKAIDAISYTNQFRHTNDTRIMAMERGLNGLTGNMSQLTSQIRSLQPAPLVNKPPAYNPPSNGYIQNNNPNYPSSIFGSVMDTAIDDLTQEEKQAEEKQEAPALDSNVVIEEGEAGLKSVSGSSNATPLIEPKRVTTTILQKIRNSQTDANSANRLIELANSVDLEGMDRFVTGDGLVRPKMDKRFKEAIMTAQREKDAEAIAQQASQDSPPPPPPRQDSPPPIPPFEPGGLSTPDSPRPATAPRHLYARYFVGEDI